MEILLPPAKVAQYRCDENSLRFAQGCVSGRSVPGVPALLPCLAPGYRETDCSRWLVGLACGKIGSFEERTYSHGCVQIRLIQDFGG